jgi:hypothetical protein
MSNLNNTPLGQIILTEAVRDFLIKRIREWFERNTVISFVDWVASGKTVFSLSTVLGQLNIAHDSEIYNLFDLYNSLDTAPPLTLASPMHFYVNSFTGSDVTGTGTALAPFRTLPRVQRILPPVINSRISIHLAGSSNYTALDDMDLRFGPNGQLLFEGMEAPTGALGPYTILTVTPLGLSLCATEIGLAIGPWVPGAQIGKFIHVLTGAHAGQYFAIGQNLAGTLYITNTAVDLVPGETFEIVNPGTVIQLPGTSHPTIGIDCPLYPSNQARLLFTNVSFQGGTIIFAAKPYADIFTAFCKFGDHMLGGGLSFVGDAVSFNEDNPFYDADITDTFLRNNDTPKTFIATSEAFTNKLSYFRTDVGYLHQTTGTIRMMSSGLSFLVAAQGVDVVADTVAVGAPGVDGFYLDRNCSLWLNKAYVAAAANVITARNSQVQVESLEGLNFMITGYTMRLGYGTNARHSGTPVIGSSGAIYWLFSAVGLPGWPVAGASVTDGDGSWELAE